MWNNLVSKASAGIEKAKVAAVQLEGSLNESVGAENTPKTATTNDGTSSSGGLTTNTSSTSISDPSSLLTTTTTTAGGGGGGEDESFEVDDAFYDDDEDDYDVDMHDDTPIPMTTNTEVDTNLEPTSEVPIPATTTGGLENTMEEGGPQQQPTTMMPIVSQESEDTGEGGEWNNDNLDGVVNDNTNNDTKDVGQVVSPIQDVGLYNDDDEDDDTNNIEEEQFVGNHMQSSPSMDVEDSKSREVVDNTSIPPNHEEINNSNNDDVKDNNATINTTITKNNSNEERILPSASHTSEEGGEEVMEEVITNSMSNDTPLAQQEGEDTPSQEEVGMGGELTSYGSGEDSVMVDVGEAIQETGSGSFGDGGMESYSSKIKSIKLPTNDDATTHNNNEAIQSLQTKIQSLQTLLIARETQLTSKSTQLQTLHTTHEREKNTLRTRVRETKDEAKKRITKAKERVEDMQRRYDEAQTTIRRVEDEKRVALASAGDAGMGKDEIVNALRMEGEALAKKQGELESKAKESRGEIRELREELMVKTDAEELAVEKIAELEGRLKETAGELKGARAGEGRASKLDADLLAEREEKEKGASSILALEAQLKEVKLKNIEMKREMDASLKGKTAENEIERDRLIHEKDMVLQDFELKLRSTERESNLREDSLRHEVSELRKRWQDAVRRADALSIDLQQSSAPLMRQIESTERQNRSRASAWVELETKLRSELEDHVVRNEKLAKENYTYDIDSKRLLRSMGEKDDALVVSASRIEELEDSLTSLTDKYEDVTAELTKLTKDYEKLMTLRKKDESTVRNNMKEILRDNEVRYQEQVESLELQLRQECENRTELEGKVDSLMMNSESAGAVVTMTPTSSSIHHVKKEKVQRILTNKSSPADILHNTLLGLGEDNNDVDDPVDEDDVTTVEDSSDSNSPTNDTTTNDTTHDLNNNNGSYALMEQITQALKASKIERDSLRRQLEESEETRKKLLHELNENADASERLPVLQAEMVEMKRDLVEKDLEIRGLRDDIMEIRSMYRDQLSSLLEEKASGGGIGMGQQQSEAQVKNNVTIDALASNFGIL